MTLLARRAATSISSNETMLHLDQTLRRGQRGDRVRLVQEWLCLHELEVKFVRTIEGNSAYATDEDPSGHAVVRQMRSYGSLDFVVLDGS